ncbi:hypothetical protein WA1_44665 [Scytonema hofmannii PCC 7110]|uniref:PatA-like N-terminal domain-containing protein n=1 Tax=Scytonema hofmannii PCC 7110 TaxID=128403 RepID=A0A139WWF8_9CYAN|nr:DUF4388 domain-containing protein [Scytonema hofmannii]KYC36770.1 hypothetical protein WA1_44665 [Scytonema hofmannii PCC 7110]
MELEYPDFVNVNKSLTVLCKQRATGELFLSSVNKHWYLYFFWGRLLYVTGGNHRVRRWYRTVTQICPKWNFEEHNLNLKKDELWEYRLLKLGIEKKQLTLTQAKSILSKSTDEVLFDIIGYSKLNSCWLPKKLHPIALLDLIPYLNTAVELRKKWRNMSLGHLHPDVAPVVNHLHLENFRLSKDCVKIIQYVNGENTIWDIASQLKQEVTEVANHIQDLVNQRVLKLSILSDLPFPIKGTSSTISFPGSTLR